MCPDQASRCRPAALWRSAAQTQAVTLAITLMLGACTPQPAKLPLPVGTGDRPDLTMPRTPSIDASLPSASSVFDAPAAAASAAVPAASAVQARANGNLSPAQESGAMPLPGQANDHSVPVSPPKAATSR